MVFSWQYLGFYNKVFFHPKFTFHFFMNCFVNQGNTYEVRERRLFLIEIWVYQFSGTLLHSWRFQTLSPFPTVCSGLFLSFCNDARAGRLMIWLVIIETSILKSFVLYFLTREISWQCMYFAYIWQKRQDLNVSFINSFVRFSD